MNNKEFLFLYDAALCNPNGDPDRENEPRMDKITETNLVSDARLKRYIRDYLIDQNKPVFVSMVGGQKVSPTTRLMGMIQELEQNEEKFNKLVESDEEGLKKNLDICKKKSEELKKLSHHKIFLNRNDAKLKDIKAKINNGVLVALIRKEFIDIRYFGGAFAIGDFSQTITGPVQINMGYSLHPVKLRSNAVVTIMGSKDGQSDIGKKETLYYSLLAFTGTINAKRGEFVNLTEKDIRDFRNSIIPSVQYNTTDSKKNQFSRLYLEIEYKKDEIYGRLGDLRSHIKATPAVSNGKGELDFSHVRNLNDLSLDFEELYKKINTITDRIEKVRIWKAVGFKSFDEKELQSTSIEILNI